MQIETKRKQEQLQLSDKIDFKSKTVTRDKEGHYRRIKKSIHQKDITIVNIYAPNIRAPKYIKQILRDLQKLIDNNTVIVVDSNTPLSTMDRSPRQKISKDFLFKMVTQEAPKLPTSIDKQNLQLYTELFPLKEVQKLAE